MPTSIPLGAPIWVDANAPDLPTELEFYTRLFGWKTFDSGEEFGHYTEFCLGTSAANARAVAGIAPNQSDQPDRSASWGVSFHVRDCVTAASEAEKLGAAAITNPMRIGDDLVFASMRDPDGGTFGLFEPLNDDMGFMAYGEPGATAWFEYVYDGAPVEAMQFYAELFDWSVVVTGSEDPDDAAPPVELRVRESGIEFGGCRAAVGPEAGLPPQWIVCFAVDSVDRVAASAVGMGGSVLMPPGDDAGMRTATLSSPGGALFGVVSEAA
ncbi:VOC family protein [Glycomyces arizonensis]|uniref:VOC family protein n=1 Tax=Glycomyces arizonensis TaxID=256035 RepID=UPI000420C0E1|nr:VOC family protein [Glycomyces arizonensis]